MGQTRQNRGQTEIVYRRVYDHDKTTEPASEAETTTWRNSVVYLTALKCTIRTGRLIASTA